VVHRAPEPRLHIGHGDRRAGNHAPGLIFDDAGDLTAVELASAAATSARRGHRGQDGPHQDPVSNGMLASIRDEGPQRIRVCGSAAPKLIRFSIQYKRWPAHALPLRTPATGLPLDRAREPIDADAGHTMAANTAIVASGGCTTPPRKSSRKMLMNVITAMIANKAVWFRPFCIGRENASSDPGDRRLHHQVAEDPSSATCTATCTRWPARYVKRAPKQQVRQEETRPHVLGRRTICIRSLDRRRKSRRAKRIAARHVHLQDRREHRSRPSPSARSRSGRAGARRTDRRWRRRGSPKMYTSVIGRDAQHAHPESLNRSGTGRARAAPAARASPVWQQRPQSRVRTRRVPRRSPLRPRRAVIMAPSRSSNRATAAPPRPDAIAASAITDTTRGSLPAVRSCRRPARGTTQTT